MRRIRYGDAHPDQIGELDLPAAEGSRPVAVLVHGGFWRDRHGLELQHLVANDLVARGFATWNVEYRRLGSGGGWPQTLDDVAAATEHLRQLAAAGAPLDLLKVFAVGHSAGGHLALLLAGRVALAGVVAQAAVSDLADAERRGLSDGAAARFVGGSRAALPARYADASPIARLPLGIPLLVVHGDVDTDVPVEQSRAFAAAARAAGDDVEYLELRRGGHMEHLDPASGAWTAAAAWLGQRAGLTPR